jgi:sirohydrochlorin cobaltochelatase
VLLVGHGTRHEQGRSQFLSLAEQVRQQLGLPLEPAFLELAQPTIEQGIKRLLAESIERLVVAPLLLFAAGHAKDDVPTAVAQALLRCGAGKLSVRQSAHFGCHPLIVELARRRLVAAIGNRAAVPAERTLLIAVGRGSSDESATAEMQAFARLLAASAAIGRVQVAFLAMAQPLVEDVLSKVDDNVILRVIVQPHLLFHGQLIERLHRQVQEIARQRPRQEWIVTRLLADESAEDDLASPLLASATVNLIEQALGEG